jgi:hypothetical protein
MRRAGRHGVVAVRDGIGDFGMRRVDPGVDDRDENLFAGGKTVRFGEMKLFRRVWTAASGGPGGGGDCASL